MPPRQLTSFEARIARAVVTMGRQENWEFAAYIESPTGPLIEMKTLMRDDGADPSFDVLSKAQAGAKIIVHHNHLSQESLSGADWIGLTTHFDETFAHCADGTTYWGCILDRLSVGNLIGMRYQSIEASAETLLSNILITTGGPVPADLAHFFRKEVVNRSMKIRLFVKYEVSWGRLQVSPYVRPRSQPAPGPAGILGSALGQHIDQAAAQLAPTL